MKNLLLIIFMIACIALPLVFSETIIQWPAMKFVAYHHLWNLTPEIVILVAIMIILTHISFAKTDEERESSWQLAMIGCCVALLGLIFLGLTSTMLASNGVFANLSVFYNMFQADLFSLVTRFVLVLGTIFVLLISRKYVSKHTPVPGEFYLILLSALFGAMLMTGAMDLIMLFVALETLGISSYIMVGYLRNDVKSAEAALKYLVYGGMATAILLFGFSLLYGLTGSTNYVDIAQRLPLVETNHIMLAIMSVCIMGGFAFKLSAAPFHMWTPDVYEGAPTPVTAFLSVVSKVAGFSVVMRFLFVLMPHLPGWTVVLGTMALLSMVIGNVLALVQTNIKRMLAYSTIAHAGYILMGLMVMSEQGLSSMLYYLVAYLFMNMGAFAIVISFHNHTGTDDIRAYAGLVKKAPALSLAFSLLLLSLAGIPVTAGFFGKFFLFQAVAAAGSQYLWLVIVALLTSTISLYYYLMVIKVMVVDEPSPEVEAMDFDESKLTFTSVGMTTAACVLGVIVLGLLAEPAMQVSNDAIAQLKAPRFSYNTTTAQAPIMIESVEELSEEDTAVMMLHLEENKSVSTK